MRQQDDGLAPGLEVAHLVRAFLLEGLIARGEDLIYESRTGPDPPHWLARLTMVRTRGRAEAPGFASLFGSSL